MIGIDDGTALKGGDDANDFDLASRAIDDDFDARRDVATFLKSAADTEALPGSALGSPPAELFAGSLKDRSQTIVLHVLKAKLQRIHVHKMGQLVHKRLPVKMVGRGCQRAVEPLPQG